MGWLADKVRKKLSKVKGKKIQIKFKSSPFKDITFLSASATEQELSAHVNSRINDLVSKAGGPDKFSETDFTIMFIDKLDQHNMVQEHELQDNEGDWETK